MATLLPPPLQIKNEEGTATVWKKFKLSWNNYELAAGIVDKEDRIRVATFLHVAGPEIFEKYEGFIWDEPEDKYKLNKVIEKFDQDYEEKTNVIAERFRFLSRKQSPRENCDQFATALRTLVSKCEYDKPAEALRDQFVLQIYDENAREKLMDEAQRDAKGLSFVRAVNIIKNHEANSRHRKLMRKETEESYEPVNKFNEVKTKLGTNNCFRCGMKHDRYRCPAFGKECLQCGKPNHLKKMCKSKRSQIKLIVDQENDKEELEEEL